MRLWMLALLFWPSLLLPAGTDAGPAVETPGAGSHLPPRLLEGPLPAYPLSLRRTGNDGSVVATFMVTKEGEVRAIRIDESSHPDFEKAAVEVLPQWRFRPATADGKPVAVRMRQTLVFSMRSPTGSLARTDAVQPYVIAGEERLPEGDRQLAVKLAAPVAYPLDLLLAGLRGTATIELFIDPQGLVAEARIVSATHPAFGAAAKASMESWVFSPALKAGQPIWSKLQREVRFDPRGRDMQLDESAARILKLLKRRPEQIVDLADLDAIPAALYRPQPIYPMDRQRLAGSVKVEFFIDRDGHAQLPKAVDFQDELLAWAAVTAVQRWRFEPPRKAGQAVDARAVVPVEFVAATEP